MKSPPLIAAAAALLGACASMADAHTGELIARCASASDRAAAHAFFADTRPGAVMPVASRRLGMPESTVASALVGNGASGAAGNEAVVRAVWDSIDAWGADTHVNLVLTSGGSHGFKFPSEVPVTQPGDGDGFLDVYADEGRGVHAHIYIPLVHSIYAVDVPGPQGQGRTRSINFYNPSGDLILGVYASMASESADPAAIAGFERTRSVIAALPPACS